MERFETMSGDEPLVSNGGLLSRRQFVRGMADLGVSAAGLALLASCGRLPSGPVAGEASLETTRLRLVRTDSICQAPQYVGEELLRGEGFAEVQYVQAGDSMATEPLASGGADIAMTFAGPLLLRIDAGDPIVVLAGGHVGCFELFGTDRVRAIRDLKGKTVAVNGLGGMSHAWTAIIAAHVGVDPRHDITWAVHSPTESMRLLAEGRIDAVMLVPPFSQELRARQIGHVVVNSTVDRPWSQYFCCVLAGNREFVRTHPIATKRALRAILKAADFCSLEPDRAARSLVDKGLTTRYDYALQTMMELPYGQWREYDPEDTLRFYALRLHEAGMIQSSPQKVIDQGTDWRFLAELKRELKV